MKDLIETIKVKGIEVGTVLFKTFPEDSKEVTTEQLLTKPQLPGPYSEKPCQRHTPGQG